MPSAEEVKAMPIQSKGASIHPIAPLTIAEIDACRLAVEALYPADIKLMWKALTLREPDKSELAPALDAEAESKTLPAIDRKAFVAYYIRNTVSRPYRVGHGRVTDVRRIYSTKVFTTSPRKPSSTSYA